MLKQITVKNLGCFDDQGCTVNFSEETLVAGPNNSGKSMLFAAMNFVRHYLVTGSFSWDTEYFNLHSFDAAVNAHDLEKEIYISFTLEERGSQYSYEFQHNRRRMQLLANRGEICPRAQPYTDVVKKIWCLRPNRSLVSYSSRVQQTSDLLQPLRPSGWNVINYLLEKWTDRSPNWNIAESWLRKIDPDMSQLKTPIRGEDVFLETTFGKTDVNMSLQGSGFQSAAAIISAVVFSPEGSTLVIEEPEAFLHPQSQEIIVDMLNDAVNNHNKQVIFSTHSCNILLPFFNDIGQNGARRGQEHIAANPNKFSMWTFSKAQGKNSIERYPLHEKTFKNFREDFKYIWG